MTCSEASSCVAEMVLRGRRNAFDTLDFVARAVLLRRGSPCRVAGAALLMSQQKVFQRKVLARNAFAGLHARGRKCRFRAKCTLLFCVAGGVLKQSLAHLSSVWKLFKVVGRAGFLTSNTFKCDVEVFSSLGKAFPEWLWHSSRPSPLYIPFAVSHPASRRHLSSHLDPSRPFTTSAVSYKTCPTRVSCKNVKQVCLTSASYKRVFQECPTRVPDKSVLQERLPRAFCKSVRQEQECQLRVSCSVSFKSQECPTRVSTRVSYKSVLQERPTRVSDKSVLQECPTRVSYKSVGQECRTRVSYKSVIQECHARVS